jgi:hypothetical protein
MIKPTLKVYKKGRQKLTGKEFPTEQVEFGHKIGVLCLRCGIYVGGLICEDCKKYEKCKLCGIVCRPQSTYEVYSYATSYCKSPVSREYCNEVKPFCAKLEDGLCEDCVCWEDYIKNKCYHCDETFYNTMSHYSRHGNFCSICIDDIEQTTIMEYKLAEAKRLEELSTDYPLIISNDTIE